MTKRIPMSVEVRGVVYPSVNDAAKALGIKPATVYCALARRSVETLGTGQGNHTDKRGGRAPIPVTLHGVTFPSMSALARFANLPVRNVRQALTIGKKLARSRLEQAVLAKMLADDCKRRSELRISIPS